MNLQVRRSLLASKKAYHSDGAVANGLNEKRTGKNDKPSQSRKHHDCNPAMGLSGTTGGGTFEGMPNDEEDFDSITEQNDSNEQQHNNHGEVKDSLKRTRPW